MNPIACDRQTTRGTIVRASIARAALVCGLVLNVAIAGPAGCAMRATSFEPAILEEGQAMLYIYRPSEGLLGGPRLTLHVDQTYIGDLPSGRYVALRVTPGGRLVRIEGKSDAVIEARLLAGESVFIEVTTAAWSGLPHISQPDTEEARRSIARTRMVPGHER